MRCPGRVDKTPVNLRSGAAPKPHTLPAPLREADPFRTAIFGRCRFEDSEPNQFRDCFRRGLLRDVHAPGEIRDRTLRFNEVLDEVAMTFPDTLESGFGQAGHDKFVDPKAEKESQVGQIDFGWEAIACFHNHGCVL